MNDPKPYTFPCDMCKKPILMDDKGLRDRTVLTLKWYDEMSSGRSSHQYGLCLDCREKLLKLLRERTQP